MSAAAGDVTMIVNAANFAAIKHKDQKRKDPEGTPYINHPLGVAHILSSVSFEYYQCMTRMWLGRKATVSQVIS